MQIGAVVRVTHGRDKSRAMVVLAEDGGRLLLADGRHRSVRRPKAKNPQHVVPMNLSVDVELVTGDRAMWRLLAQAQGNMNGRNGGV